MRFAGFDENVYRGMRQLLCEWRMPVQFVPEAAVCPEEVLAAVYPAGHPMLENVREYYAIGKMEMADTAVHFAGMKLHSREDDGLLTRSRLAELARALCRQFGGQPVLAAFLCERHLTLAFAERSGHRNDTYPVKVSMMRDIALTSPNSAHRRWLAALRLPGQGAAGDIAAGYRHLQSVFSAAYWRKSLLDDLYSWHVEAREQANGGEVGRTTASERPDELLIRLVIRLLFARFIEEARIAPALRADACGQLDAWFAKWAPRLADEDERSRRSLRALLNRYPFTLEENTPLEADAALDPELIGTVFEQWLESGKPTANQNARTTTGSYYTPKAIVNGMVERTLAVYLKERLPGDEASRERLLARLLSEEDGRPFGDDRLAAQIVRHLDACKIFDPACGSGAFLIGALHKLTTVLNKLDPLNAYWKQRQIDRAEQLEDADARAQALREIEAAFAGHHRPDYVRKRYLIAHCLYGVDIQPLAVQICKLRLLLSLLADWNGEARHARDDVQLPDPDMHVVAANTLVPLDMPEQGWNGTTEAKAIRAKRLAIRRRLFNANTSAMVRKLREEDRELRMRLASLLRRQGWREASVRQLADWDPYDPHRTAPFFDMTWMFNVPDGFDIVIGNPPYLGERKNKSHFVAVQQSPMGRYYLGRMDYFYFFFHLGIDLLKEAGVGAYLTTNYFTTALGARKLRTDLKERTTLLALIDFNEAKIFDGAAGQHNMITVFQRGKRATAAKVKNVRETGVLSEDQLAAMLGTSDGELQLAQDELWDGEENYLRLTGLSGQAAPINLALDLLKKAATDVLGNICRPLIGLESSLDSVYVADLEFWRKTVVDEREWAYIKPFFKNSDIARFQAAVHTDRYILYVHEQIPDIAALPGIYRYLLTHKPQIASRKGANLRGAYRRGNWWALNTPRLDMDFEGEKIVTPYRSKTVRFAFVREPWYASRDVYYIVKRKPDVSLLYILALLNSSLYYQWLYHRGKRKGDMLELYAKPLKEIPIKEVAPAAQQPFIRLAEMASLAAWHAPDKLPTVEKVIDALVFDLVFGDYMKERGLTTSPWIIADLNAAFGERDVAAFGQQALLETLDVLCGRWTNPEGEVAKRMLHYAARSPELLGPILNTGSRGELI